jgi:hypothetical protein
MRHRAFLSRSPGFARLIGGIIKIIIWHSAPIIAMETKKAKSGKPGKNIGVFSFFAFFISLRIES